MFMGHRGDGTPLVVESFVAVVGDSSHPRPFHAAPRQMYFA